MSWCDALESPIRRDEALAARTTFGIGGPAAFFVEPASPEQFASSYAAAVASGLPVYVLGGGSNLLISDKGVPGIVLSTSRLADEKLVADGTLVVAQAGTSLARLLAWTEQEGLAGLECLAGIPGTVGGAVAMNAGGKHGCIGSRVSAVWCVGRDGRLVRREARDIRWGYRFTDIAAPIVVVEFLLERDDPRAIRARAHLIRVEKRRSQPVRFRSAGCFFRNPERLFAGQLIEQAGMKGARVGAACVSKKHANFIVNLGGARAADVLALSSRVEEKVFARFGIILEREVCCWP